jgi:hypothetical protein
VEIQRKSGGKWRRYATYSAKLGNGAKAWSYSARVKKAGSYRVRARHMDGDHLETKSLYRAFTVR